MDYKEKYEQALKVAKETYDKQPMYRDWLDKMFPELKESEDERIRGAIIGHLKDNNLTEWAAWLEKQEGCEYIKKDWLEHIKQSWYKEGFIDGKYSGGTSKEWTINDAATLKELIDFLENGTAKLQHDLTRYADWLKNQFTLIEKQGENCLVGFDEA